MSRRPKDSPFGALAALRGRLAPPPTGKPEARPLPPAAAADDADAAALFHAALGNVTPLPADDHAAIERPRPAPLPRPRGEEAEPEPARRAPAPDPNDAAALFRHEMADVTRLSDHGRVEIGRRRAHAIVATLPAALTADARPAPVDEPWLPDDVDDPAALFRHAVGAAAPLPDANRAELARPAPAPHPRQREEDEAAVLREAIAAPLSFEDRIDIGDEGVHLRDGLPRRVLTDLRRGRWVVQAELDLHGLTRDEARSALGHFLHDALEHGYRCVRLIHGKGLGSPGREPVLKHLSRGWLMQREEILAFCQARPHDGGEGALLVLLRAPRNTERP
ncbi:Smr/MutS family protein [Azospira restricta]|uniref:Smr/MutS family protein n=1 Tax=Azospira restricta TaxID=404405 RepID=A0A974PXN8_9RHOO|nr:Smr/MutS family protein [Azospira restricta]QRJ63154.1 Smr/MutS family protein [Azospira restricta]